MARLRTAAAASALAAGLVATAATGAWAAPKETPGPSIDRQDFSDGVPPGWIIVEQEPSGANVEGGAVVARVSQPDSAHRVITTQPAPAPASYAVEVDARFVSGDDNRSAWGVTCHGTIDQSYEFLVSSDGYAAILRNLADGIDRLDAGDKAQQRRARKAIKPKKRAVNRVRGECFDGGELRMFVNGRFVAQATDPAPLSAGTTWGFQPVTFETTDELVVSFDDFELFDLTSSG